MKELLSFGTGASALGVSGGVSIDRFSEMSNFLENNILGRIIANEDIANATSNIVSLILASTFILLSTYLVGRGVYKGGEFVEDKIARFTNQK